MAIFSAYKVVHATLKKTGLIVLPIVLGIIVHSKKEHKISGEG